MRSARVLACIVLMGGVAGCGGVGDLADLPPPAPEEVAQLASDSYVSCIVDQARKIDDGKGTPIAVALKIVSLCEMQFISLQAVSSRGADPVSASAVRDNLKQRNEAFVTSIVQRMRLAHELGP